MRLASLQVKHANERPAFGDIQKSHSRYCKHGIPRPAVVTLDQKTQEHHLVFFIIPLKGLVPNGFSDRGVLALVQEGKSMLFVSRGFAFGWFTAEIIRVDQRAGNVWLHVVGCVVLWGGYVGSTTDVETETLLTSSAELAIASCAESGGFEDVPI